MFSRPCILQLFRSLIHSWRGSRRRPSWPCAVWHCSTAIVQQFSQYRDLDVQSLQRFASTTKSADPTAAAAMVMRYHISRTVCNVTYILYHEPRVTCLTRVIRVTKVIRVTRVTPHVSHVSYVSHVPHRTSPIISTSHIITYHMSQTKYHITHTTYQSMDLYREY